MEIEGLSFYEALKLLAERHGIPMPKRAGISDPQSKLRGSLYDIHELAARLFGSALESAAGASAREYLKKRGISKAVAAEFGIGYAPPSGQVLLKQLEKQGATSEQMDACGSGHETRWPQRLL